MQAVRAARRKHDQKPGEVDSTTRKLDAPLPTSTLRVGPANDPTEADADRFAAGLMRDLHSRPTAVHRSANAGVRDELGGSAVSADTASRIQRASGGAALPDRLRAAAEQSSGRDLSGVRVHAGGDAAQLSRSLQATAFTVGSNVFLGADAARPGTSAGDALLGHEVGHVVQQGGGIASRSIRRQPSLAPLVTGRPTVQRLFGKKDKDPIGTVNKKVAASGTIGNGPTKMVKISDLDKQISSLESALKKLKKHHVQGNQESTAAAYGLSQAADKILHRLPQGPARAPFAKHAQRLTQIVGDAQVIYDEHRVAALKRAAGPKYMQSGKDFGTDKPGAFTQLTAPAKKLGFDALVAKPDSDAEKDGSKSDGNEAGGLPDPHAMRKSGADAGLSAAEIAAIITFTVEDYKYINPATAGSADWMKGSNPAWDHIDKFQRTDDETEELRNALEKSGMTARERMDERKAELAKKREEGSAHAAMAMQGFARMTPWKGTLFHGEVLDMTEFDGKYRTSAKRIQKGYLPFPNGTKLKPANPISTRAAIASSSKDPNKAREFWTKTKVREPKVQILWEMDVINGRDIENISASRGEREVATLPGAEFVITSVAQVADKPPNNPHNYVLIRCKQRK